MKKSREIIQKEALETLLPLDRAGAGITMGGGKTLLGLRHMDANYTEHAKFLVAAPKLSVKEEWLDEAKKHNLEHLVDHIMFTTYLSLYKQSHDYDVLYLDECHSLLLSHDYWLSRFEGKILGLSGTPPKYAYSEKGKMVATYCPIAYTYETDEAIDDDVLNDYKVLVHTLELNTKKDILVNNRNGGQWYTDERTAYNYWSNRIHNAATAKALQITRVQRMKALQGFSSKERLAKKILDESTDKTLLFANTQQQSDMFGIPSYHSKNKDSEQNLKDFKDGTINKLACVLQLSEGVNIPNLKVGIIMHSYGNERKSSQRMGRLLRLSPDEIATIHILCYKDTVDEDWVKQALENFNPDKITWV